VDCLLSEPPSPQEASPTHQEICPKCSNRLGPPLKSSGRQICIKCGWTDKPKSSLSLQQDEALPRAASASASLPDYELKKLLDQAASESLNNMKPKRKQTQNSNKNKLPPLEGEGD
jgi:ribosomal protein S27AE